MTKPTTAAPRTLRQARTPDGRFAEGAHADPGGDLLDGAATGMEQVDITDVHPGDKVRFGDHFERVRRVRRGPGIVTMTGYDGGQVTFDDTAGQQTVWRTQKLEPQAAAQ